MEEIKDPTKSSEEINPYEEADTWLGVQIYEEQAAIRRLEEANKPALKDMAERQLQGLLDARKALKRGEVALAVAAIAGAGMNNIDNFSIATREEIRKAKPFAHLLKTLGVSNDALEKINKTIDLANNLELSTQVTYTQDVRDAFRDIQRPILEPIIEERRKKRWESQ